MAPKHDDGWQGSDYAYSALLVLEGLLTCFVGVLALGEEQPALLAVVVAILVALVVCASQWAAPRLMWQVEVVRAALLTVPVLPFIALLTWFACGIVDGDPVPGADLLLVPLHVSIFGTLTLLAYAHAHRTASRGLIVDRVVVEHGRADARGGAPHYQPAVQRGGA